jgi:hypothetical protein
MTKYYNKSRITEPPLKEGDKVYLLRRNIKTKRPSNKLDFKKLGPFMIERKISNTNYQLSLPDTMRIHPVFHISLLEPAPANAKTQDQVEAEGEPEFEVEAILDSRQQNQQIKYLVKWKGYPHEENTWEPTEHLENSQIILEKYHQGRQIQPITKETEQHRNKSHSSQP